MRTIILISLMFFAPLTFSANEHLELQSTNNDPLFDKVIVDFDKKATTEIVTKVNGIGLKIVSLSQWLLNLLVSFQLLWVAIKQFRGGSISIASFLGEVQYVLWIVVLFNTFFISLSGFSHFYGFVVSTFEDTLSAGLGGSIEFKNAISLQGWLNTTIEIINAVFSGPDRNNPLVTFVLIICAFIYVILSAGTYFILVMLYLEFQIATSLSALFLMWLGSEHTKDIGVRFIWYIVGTGAALFTGVLWLSVLNIVMISQATNTTATLGSMMTLIVITLFMFFGMQTIPKTIGSFFGATSSAYNTVGSTFSSLATTSLAVVAGSTISKVAQTGGSLMGGAKSRAEGVTMLMDSGLTKSEANQLSNSLFKAAKAESKQGNRLSGSKLNDPLKVYASKVAESIHDSQSGSGQNK